jgi:hypothetical protein
MNPSPRITFLINAAFALIENWEHRPVSREQWHRADEYMVAAAMIDADAVMDAWERLAIQYEAWLARHPDTEAA